MKVLVDTNILGRLVQPDHEMHFIVSATVEQLLSDGHDLRTVPQVIYEFWAIATRPAENNGLGLTTEQTFAEIERLQQIFPVLRDERGILEYWKNLVSHHQVRGKTTHDARIVAAIHRH